MFRQLFYLTVFAALAVASPITVDYTLNMGSGGSNKTPVTSIAVFQSSGSQLNLSFINSIAGTGTTNVSVTAPFQPSYSLLIGISEPADPTGRRHLIAFVSQSFADTYSGIKFSQAFPGYGELAFGPHLLAAYGGDAAEQDWLKTFYTSQGYKAAFATGTVPIPGEFTPFGVIPEPATYSLAAGALLAILVARRKR